MWMIMLIRLRCHLYYLLPVFFGLAITVNKFSKVRQSNFYVLIKGCDKDNKRGSYEKMEEKNQNCESNIIIA